MTPIDRNLNTISALNFLEAARTQNGQREAIERAVISINAAILFIRTRAGDAAALQLLTELTDSVSGEIADHMVKEGRAVRIPSP